MHINTCGVQLYVSFLYNFFSGFQYHISHILSKVQIKLSKKMIIVQYMA